jgi:gamma-glutamyltranspeptidase/glutathione hydrolase
MTRRPLLQLLVASTALIFSLGAAPPPAVGRAGMVAADHPLCSEAAASVLAKGGNAVDGAVAAALACGVVQPSSSGLGGGGFAVVVPPSGDPAVLDFRETAPAAATRDMFVADGVSDDASTRGGLAVGVPGEPAGLAELHHRWGALPLRVVAAPAARLAREGFEAGPHLAHALQSKGELGVTLSRALYSAASPERGDRVRNPALARTIDAWARSGGTALSEGPLARRVVASAQAAGGVLTAADLAAYTPRDRAPVVGSYRGWTVVTMPPPSSGGVVLLQILSVLEATDLAAEGHNSAAYVHRLAEAMQHAFADRARTMGDPDRVEVPVDALLSDARVAEVRQRFVPSRTFDAGWYGMAIDVGRDAGTQHISVLDRDGLAVALTTTVNTSFGSKVVVPGVGVVLNNEMDDFVARPGEPNAFGLVGSEANAVAPGARPLSSMSPTVLISPDGRERIVVGASGGPFIISSTLQVILNLIDFEMDPSTAVSVPRMHHQWQPQLLFLDAGYPVDTVELLEARGHATKSMPFFSAVQVIHAADGRALGASDPRKGGWPVGVR